MAVHLAPAEDPRNIQESEYGTAAWVQFSPITSCILIAGITDDGSVAGIHLVMVQPDGAPFGVDDVAVVTTRLGEMNVTPATIIVFGQTQMWDDNVRQPYRALLGALGRSPAQAIDLNDGTYGAQIAGAGGAVQIFQAGQRGRKTGGRGTGARRAKPLS